MAQEQLPYCIRRALQDIRYLSALLDLHARRGQRVHLQYVKGQVDYRGKKSGCCNEVHDSKEMLVPRDSMKSAALVVPGEEDMEEGDDSARELGPS